VQPKSKYHLLQGGPRLVGIISAPECSSVESPAALLLLDKANLKASPLSDRYSTIEYNAFLNDVNTIFHSS
jgi:hypothetical protein